MITKKEFLKALEIVNEYKRQTEKQFEEMQKHLNESNFDKKNIVNKKQTIISKSGLSIKALNACVYAYFLQDENSNRIDYSYRDKLNLEDLKNIKRSDFKKFPNTGVKTIQEIERVLFEVGIILKQ